MQTIEPRDKKIETGKDNCLRTVSDGSSGEIDPPLDPQSLTVLMDTTNQCNLRCRMCHFSKEEIAHSPQKLMSPKSFERVADQIFPYARSLVLSAAAEPLIHPEFRRLLTIAAEYRPPHLAFLTNAQRLTPEISAHCIQCGVTEIHVSIDGATRETYEWIRRKASFQQLIENLRQLQRLKREHGSRWPIVQFNMTLMRKNVTELSELARLAVSLGVERIACRHLVLYAGLGLERQSLAADKRWANRQVARHLAAMADYEVSIVEFPDFFPVEGAAGDFFSDKESSKRELFSSPPSTLRPERGSGWFYLPHRWRWRLQSALHRRRAAGNDIYPIGAIDTPAQERNSIAGGLRFSGWALHHAGIAKISVGRKPFIGERPGRTDIFGLIPVGDARRHNGLRSDLVSAFPGFPETVSAAWTFSVPRESLPARFEESIFYVSAWGGDGKYSILGRRIVFFADAEPLAFPAYCKKPFESVYIDSSANVYPYADCLNCKPFGSLAQGKSFSSIWRGRAFRQLRHQILLDRPPAMCLACPDLINRRVDDPHLFRPRRIAP